mgnify:CR=1 FL=1
MIKEIIHYSEFANMIDSPFILIGGTVFEVVKDD